MADMMFPDTSNEQQRAALCHAAERARAISNPEDECERAMHMALVSMRDGIDLGSYHQLSRFASAPEGLDFANR